MFLLSRSRDSVKMEKEDRKWTVVARGISVGGSCPGEMWKPELIKRISVLRSELSDTQTCFLLVTHLSLKTLEFGLASLTCEFIGLFPTNGGFLQLMRKSDDKIKIIWRIK